ncbi:thioredoxin family protein [Hydrogenivirga sp.]
MVVIELLESNFCPKCAAVKEKVTKVAKELGVEVKMLDPIDDADRIVELGVLTSPAVIVNGKVKFAGVIPTEEKIRQAVEEELS